jgi:putative membrane protein
MTAALAYLHYIALGLAFIGIFSRGRALKALLSLETRNTRELFLADNIWGISALILIITGLARAMGRFEKGPHYYMSSHWFWLKMVLFLLVFLMEIYPMITFIQWRISKKQITEDDVSKLSRLRKINHIEALLVFFIPLVATIMARGGMYWR